MLEACAQFPGYLFSMVVPPRREGEEFHIVQKFASRAELEAWKASEEAADWHARLRDVSDHEPEYRILNDNLWFSAKAPPVAAPPARWRMAVVTWIGIFPTACLFIGLLLPVLMDVPFIPRIAVLTMLIVAAMYYVVMPRLLRWMAWWLKG
ncbi:hypothetical protein D9M68_784480 [compost metagenome]